MTNQVETKQVSGMTEMNRSLQNMNLYRKVFSFYEASIRKRGMRLWQITVSKNHEVCFSYKLHRHFVCHHL
jgi:hypothetical protein